MKYLTFVATALASMASVVSAVGVVGKPEGFASGATGGGSAAAVYPSTNEELVSYLGDSTARVIVLSKTFDFTTSEGTATASGCLPWGTGTGCQVAIDKDEWCENYEAKAPRTSGITYNKAGALGINVGSNKSLVGEGSKGIIKGKGLRIVNGAKNVIIQNVQISDINHKYVWGGDAITLDQTDLVWIDHVTTARVGRQHIVLGTEASGRVSITNSYIDGTTDYSATCDDHTYWAIYLAGSKDMVTMKGNHIYYTSGRSPKVTGNTILHAVNNYWDDNSDHAFEVGTGAYILAEGNVFNNVKSPVESGGEGKLFTASGGSCSSYIGRNCVANSLESSGAFSQSDTGVLSDFKGKTVAAAEPASGVVSSVTANAGMGKLKQ